VSRGVKGLFSGWIEAGRGVGFFLLLAGGSGVLGFAIAWPLWFFATSQRTAYTIFVLCAAGVGIIVLAARGAARRRRAARDRGAPRGSVAAVLIALVQAVVVLAGLWSEAVFIARRFWPLAVVGLLAWAAIVWALGVARRALKKRKQAAVPAENKDE
jgi:hypothetical protein